MTASAKALRQQDELGVLRNRKKSGWRLVSKWDMVTLASGKVKKLNPSVLTAHSEGFECCTENRRNHWKILSRTEMISFVFS